MFIFIVSCHIMFSHHLISAPTREQPIFSTRAHVFQIDPTTKRNWIPASKHAVSVSFFYDANRNVYRIISVGGTKVRWPQRGVKEELWSPPIAQGLSWLSRRDSQCRWVQNH